MGNDNVAQATWRSRNRRKHTHTHTLTQLWSPSRTSPARRSAWAGPSPSRSPPRFRFSYFYVPANVRKPLCSTNTLSRETNPLLCKEIHSVHTQVSTGRRAGGDHTDFAREYHREQALQLFRCLSLSLSLYIYIYIYMYTYCIYIYI